MNQINQIPRLAIHCLIIGLCSLNAAAGQNAQATAAATEWVKVSPEGAGFEVLMPVEPKISTQEVKPMADRRIKVHLASANTRGGKAVFMTAYHDLDFDVVDEKKIRDVLDGGVQGSLLNALGKISKHEQIQLGKHPGRHFEYAGNRYNQKIEAVSRIYLVGRRVIQVTVLRTPETELAADITKFFESFKLLEAQAKPPADPFTTGDAAPKGAAPRDGGGK